MYFTFVFYLYFKLSLEFAFYGFRTQGVPKTIQAKGAGGHISLSPHGPALPHAFILSLTVHTVFIGTFNTWE